VAMVNLDSPANPVVASVNLDSLVNLVASVNPDSLVNLVP